MKSVVFSAVTEAMEYSKLWSPTPNCVLQEMYWHENAVLPSVRKGRSLLYGSLKTPDTLSPFLILPALCLCRPNTHVVCDWDCVFWKKCSVLVFHTKAAESGGILFSCSLLRSPDSWPLPDYFLETLYHTISAPTWTRHSLCLEQCYVFLKIFWATACS